MAETNDDAVGRVRELAARVGASRRNANELVELIDLCSADDGRVALAAVQGCRGLFTQWAHSGDLVASRAADAAAAGGGAGTDASPAQVYRSWLRARYAAWLSALGTLVAKHDDAGVRLPALDTLLQMARLEGTRLARAGEARTATLAKGEGALTVAFDALAECAECEPHLLAHLKKGYLSQFVDVSYHGLQHCQRLAARLEGRHRCTPARCARVLDLLIVVRPPSADLDADRSLFLTLPAPDTEAEGEEGGGSAAAARKRKRADEAEAELPSDARRLLALKVHRLAFQAAWLAVLKLPLARADVRRVLTRAESAIIPHMARPLRLAGWVLRAYEQGGIVSLHALSALFELMQHHNLECPQFFPKLYALLRPAALECAYRSRFFLTLEIFISSTHLPAYLSAAFAKRLARLALGASPSGCMLALGLALNLLVRHAELSVLVHRTGAAPPLGSALPGSSPEEHAAEAAAPPRRADADADALATHLASDPFLPDEPEPAKCRALESSLWEVDALRRHYLPAVARLAEQFTLPMHGAAAKVTRVDVDEFTQLSYPGLFQQELRWRRGRPTPLAFKKKRALFADDGDDATGLACFRAGGPHVEDS